jgi:hypothetical protein
MPSTVGIVASSQNFPLSLNPALWLDAADTTTITASSGSVSQWNDKSGNGRNVTQGTGGNQPTTGSSNLNGLNVISFDGTDDFISSANDALSFATVRLFVVARSTVINRVIVGVPHDATHVNPFFRYVLYHQTSNILNIRLNGSASTSIINVVTTNMAQRFRLESDEGDAYVNGSRVINASGVTLTYPNSTPLRIGANAVGGEPLNGFVAEVLLFNYSLNANQTNQVETYLQSKWGI